MPEPILLVCGNIKCRKYTHDPFYSEKDCGILFHPPPKLCDQKFLTWCLVCVIQDKPVSKGGSRSVRSDLVPGLLQGQEGCKGGARQGWEELGPPCMPVQVQPPESPCESLPPAAAVTRRGHQHPSPSQPAPMAFLTTWKRAASRKRDRRYRRGRGGKSCEHQQEGNRGSNGWKLLCLWLTATLGQLRASRIPMCSLVTCTLPEPAGILQTKGCSPTPPKPSC